jgi:hypothetical protein
MSSIYEERARRLTRYMMGEGFEGYDPYDCLNSPIIGRIGNRHIKIFLTQVMVYSPVNMRRLLSIPKGINPKGAGLTLRSLVKMRRTGLKMDGTDGSIRTLHDWLIQNHNKEFSGMCWGYNFSWEDVHKSIPMNSPSIVVTSFIGHALLDLYESDQEVGSKDRIGSITDFILNDLNMNEDEDGLCFSYSPFDETMTHNANLLGSSFLARAGRFLGRTKLIDIARKGYGFTLAKQSPDGSWPYSIPKKGSSQRAGNQIDYHQGFIIDCLFDGIKFIGDDGQMGRRIDLALGMYERLFNASGRSYWRYPLKWPSDIHSQAQGIITFLKASERNPRYFEIAKRVMDWTLVRMTSKDRDYFYYQKWPLLTNRISYMRWGQAWMLYALVLFLEHRGVTDQNA